MGVKSDERYQRIFRRVLERIRPKSSPLPTARRFAKALEQRLAAAGINASVMIGGSTAKGTFLAGDYDVDLFVRFDYETYAPQDDRQGSLLSDLLERVLPPEAERIHGSRDYFQLQHGALTYELVPVLRIEEARQAKNVTDVSPLHVAYAQRHLRGKNDEVRLAKQFCKAAKVYGAESYLNGFSGHVLDLLIIHYGSFLQLLRATTSWKPRVVIDLEGGNRLELLDPSKRRGPLILFDPVQPARNAAAALSREKFEAFKAAARAFLERPSLAAFTVRKLTPAQVRRWYARASDGTPSRLILFRTTPLEGKRDVVATKLLKLHEYVIRHLRLAGFTVLDDLFEFRGRDALHALILKEEVLSPTVLRVGPPLRAKRDAARFRQKHPDARVEQGRLVVELPRTHRRVEPALQEILAAPEVKKRCSRLTLHRR